MNPNHFIHNQTGKFYFDNLPLDVQARFKENYETLNSRQSFASVLEGRYDSNYDFISTAFAWKDSPEQKEYWENVALRNFEYIKDIPPHPKTAKQSNHLQAFKNDTENSRHFQDYL